MSLLDTATSQLREARDFLLEHREDYATAYRDYRPPELDEFNWALDWFDAIAAGERGGSPALWIVEPDGSEARRTFAELAARSNQVANWLRERCVARGDRVIVMLGNQVELWETILAAMKLGAVRTLASKGMGVAMMPRSVGEEPGPPIELRPIGPEPLTWPVALVWRVARRQTPAGKAFLKVAIEYAERTERTTLRAA